MLELRGALQKALDELVGIVVAELGKTIADAGAEVDRAIEVLGQLASIGSWYVGAFSPGVSRGVDAMEVRFPIGVVAAISPFNFPVLIPVVQSATALACGNTVILKPSERDPSATLRLAEILPAPAFLGALNVVLGGKAIVDRLVDHPGIAGISFVGSTPVAKQSVSRRQPNKRVRRSAAARTTWWCCRRDLDLRQTRRSAPTARRDSVAWRFQWWSPLGRLATRSFTRSRTGWRSCAQAIPPNPPPRLVR
jgi:malonate-semialdehyde dehydrogenase (acetylating)/methylmalonate-semialdehyde dehydrogenase